MFKWSIETYNESTMVLRCGSLFYAKLDLDMCDHLLYVLRSDYDSYIWLADDAVLVILSDQNVTMLITKGNMLFIPDDEMIHLALALQDWVGV